MNKCKLRLQRRRERLRNSGYCSVSKSMPPNVLSTKSETTLVPALPLLRNGYLKYAAMMVVSLGMVMVGLSVSMLQACQGFQTQTDPNQTPGTVVVQPVNNPQNPAPGNAPPTNPTTGVNGAGTGNTPVVVTVPPPNSDWLIQLLPEPFRSIALLALALLGAAGLDKRQAAKKST